MRTEALDYLKNMTDRRPNVMEYVDLIALHPFLDSSSSPDNLDVIHKRYGKQILYTEMSFSVFDTPPGIASGSWNRAEELIMILMESLGHDVAGFVDWIVILDANGGPSYVNASYNAYIHANEDFTAFYKQHLYYAMAHCEIHSTRHIEN